MMKKFISALLAGLVLFPEIVLAAPTISHDKFDHAATCYGIEATLAQAKPFQKWKPWQRVLFTTAVIGGGKEWYDSKHPKNHTADWNDIAADFVGASTAEGTLWLVHKSF